MFIRVALLLLIANIVFIEASKIQDVLKKIGKRNFFSSLFDDWCEIPYVCADREARKYRDNWALFEEAEINNLKERTVKSVISYFFQASSSGNPSFNASLIWMSEILDSEFVGEICGSEKKMNTYQFIKYLTHTGSQYEEVIIRHTAHEVSETDREDLQFSTTLPLRSKSGINTRMEYQFKMKPKFVGDHVYQITNLSLGGSCPDFGTASEKEKINWDFDNIGALEKHPLIRNFFELIWKGQNPEENPDDLPKSWYTAIHPNKTKLFVCTEGLTDPLEYTKDQFISWYTHFGLMWHPKAGTPSNETYTMHVQEMLYFSVSTRITMKLQMGRKPDAVVHDWNFKFSARKAEGTNDTWFFERIDVLCNPMIEYKDQSLINIRDVIIETFVHELNERNVTEWHTSVDFTKRFTKNGHVDLTDCENGAERKITQVDLFTKDQQNMHGINFTKYINEEGDIPLPAADSNEFQFKTVSVTADSSPEEKKEFEHEWKFDLKWDPMDQFYYIEKMGIGCEKPWTIGGAFSSIWDKLGR